MAQYRGTVRGGRGEGSRLGHKTSGLTTVAKGWGGYIQTHLWWHIIYEEDWCSVVHHHGNGGADVLYRGPLDRYADPRGTPLPIEEVTATVKDPNNGVRSG